MDRPALQRIAIHGVPRSGTSWLGQIINSSPQVLYKYQPLFSYALKDYLNAKSSTSEIEKFFDLLACTNSDFLDQTEAVEKGLAPVFSKSTITHIAYKEVRYHHIIRNLLERDKAIKIIGIIRNPLAVINSWLQAPREFRRDLGWQESEEWLDAPKKNLGKAEEFYGFNKWKEVTNLFHAMESQFPENFKLISYDDLLTNTHRLTAELYDFCGIPLTHQTEDYLRMSNTIHNPDTYSTFRTKSKDDDWKKTLDPDIIAAITADLQDTMLSKYI